MSGDFQTFFAQEKIFSQWAHVQAASHAIVGLDS